LLTLFGRQSGRGRLRRSCRLGKVPIREEALGVGTPRFRLGLPPVAGERIRGVSSLGVACFALPIFIIANLGLGLSGCGGRNNGATLGERVIPLGQKVPKGGGYYQVGKPYQIAGVWYQPREEPGYDRVGSASWYGELFHGRRTANGEIYDMDRISAAHPTLPLPVYARVTNLNNGRTIVVRINDRDADLVLGSISDNLGS
jgi:hypothetical protein